MTAASPATVLVTGGAGFIGANLVRRLLAGGHRVAVVDDLSTGDRGNLTEVEGRISFHEGTVLDAGVLDAAMAGADAVVHLAARPSVPRSIDDPVATHRANADGTLAVLEAARRAQGATGGNGPHVLVASSSSVYGANPVLPKSEGLVPQPRSPYAASKLAAEAYALAYHHSYGLDVLVFRFFNVFGPLQPAGHAYAAVVPAFVDDALAGRSVTVHGDGTQTRDFTYVDSVTAVLADAVGRRVVDDQPVNLAFGTRTDLLGVLARLEALLGHPVERVHAAPRPGDVAHSSADASRLQALFPTVEPVDLDAGLAATVAWMRARRDQGPGA
ncbi:MAG: NAD-dependent epimerase/dehydratase family protein [Acidimicrobiales bacterium]|nr:NAD-dependent epimerase/dehydratase family protein [Acidimicrobiales bacterium]